MRRLMSAFSGFAMLASAACFPITFDCGEGQFRSTEGRATVSDVGDTIHVDATVSVNENRGHPVVPDRQLVISVQSVRAPNPDTVPAALVGHVPFVRLELSTGAV